MAKKFLVIVIVEDEKMLRNSYQTSAGIEDEEMNKINTHDLVVSEMGWIESSGLSHNVVREITDDEVDLLVNNDWVPDGL